MSDDRIIKDESDRYIWISPRGRVFKVPYMGHRKFAEKLGFGCNGEDFMQDDGWIKCGTSCCGDYIFSKRKPSDKQVFIVFKWAKKFGAEEPLETFCARWDI